MFQVSREQRATCWMMKLVLCLAFIASGWCLPTTVRPVTDQRSVNKLGSAVSNDVYTYNAKISLSLYVTNKTKYRSEFKRFPRKYNTNYFRIWTGAGLLMVKKQPLRLSLAAHRGQCPLLSAHSPRPVPVKVTVYFVEIMFQELMSRPDQHSAWPVRCCRV